MPIAFESIQDPLGIASSGTLLGKMMFDRGTQKREQEFALQGEDRTRKFALEKENLLEQKQQKYASILDETMSKLPENPTMGDFLTAAGEANKAGVPMDVIKNYGTLAGTLQKAYGDQPPTPKKINEISELFQKFGMSKEDSDRNSQLWGELTTGGRTEMAKYLVDQIARGQAPSDFTTGKNPNEEFLTKEEAEFIFPKVNPFEGRTPKEKTSLKTDLLKLNTPDYKEIVEKMRTLDSSKLRFDQLERLNDSEKLPESFEKLNVNWTTGDIRFPALANAETQLFVKTVNDFTVEAKDSYGARVSNFELGTFMKRLPTLANSPEGRRLILAQMKAMNNLNREHEESIKKVYDKYGLQNIDRQQVEKIAKEYRDFSGEEKKYLKDFENAIYAQDIYEARQNAPDGHLPIRSKEGKIGYIPFDKVEEAKKKGFEIL